MAARLLTARCRIVAYMPNLTAAVRHFAAFSPADAVLAPQVALPAALRTADPLIERGSSAESLSNRLPFAPGVVTTLTQAVDSKCDLSVLQQFSDNLEAVQLKPTSVDLLECVAQDCPSIMRKDFQDLFPDRDLSKDNFTIITLSQKTENDMTAWNETVEEERELLLKNFIEGAKDICQSLWQAGYWADFVDPASGVPYFGSHTNSTLFETDERYRKLGFGIEDLGCCKVISHHLWGTHSYVGSLFTNAPMDAPMIQQITRQA